MDRKAYKLPFKKNGYIRWECPSCMKGRLKIKSNTFHFEETKESKRARGHEAWDPDWIEYVYSCLLECSSCKETIANSGTGAVDFDVEYDEDGYPTQGLNNFFTPKHFSPHLKIFCFPRKTPEKVSDEIQKSFSLFFSDPPSAANHIRIALEELLTNLKIKRHEIKNKRRTFLALHRRIDLLPAKFNHLKELLFAVKWLGNAGSHSSKRVTKDDVLDSYEIMEEILQELYVKKSSQIKKLAKKINKIKGPTRKMRMA